jgi:hypothetical protein
MMKEMGDGTKKNIQPAMAVAVDDGHTANRRLPKLASTRVNVCIREAWPTKRLPGGKMEIGIG